MDHALRSAISRKKPIAITAAAAQATRNSFLIVTSPLRRFVSLSSIRNTSDNPRTVKNGWNYKPGPEVRDDDEAGNDRWSPVVSPGCSRWFRFLEWKTREVSGNEEGYRRGRTLINKLVIQNLTHRPIRTVLCVFAIALQVER